MPSHVLVAYGSKNGSTREIAGWIVDALNSAGCEAVAEPAADVRTPAPYDAVVLGGALYAGRWHRDTARFARRHTPVLRGRPVWLFSSGPLDSSASEREIPPVRQVRRVAERLGARGHITFGGKLDTDAEGWMARRIVAAGQGGDHRDPDSVASWATGIARELRRASPTS